MTKRYRLLLLALLAAAVAVPAAVQAAITNPVIDFGVSYAKEDSRAANDKTSTAGDTLTIVGKVANFQDPFADLDAHSTTLEYTYVMTGLVSGGSYTDGPYYNTDYSGGTLRIYEDPSMDADFGNMATFSNGTLILEATFTSFQTAVIQFPTCDGTQNGGFQFTGGTLFSRVSEGGIGYTGIDTGAFAVCSTTPPSAQVAQGYFGESDTKLDVNPPTPVEKSSWGGIKTRYED